MTKRLLYALGTVLTMVLLLVDFASAQSPEAGRLFEQSCMTCHGNASVEKAPDPSVLRQMSPEAVYKALTTGAMAPQAAQLSDEQKHLIAEYLGGRNMVEGSGDAALMPNKCASNPRISGLSAAPAWNGWSADAGSGRFQTAKAADISADQVHRLKLKWAFGFPGATAVYGQPSVVAGRVFVGVNTGYVYSLDAATGCVYWSFEAQAGVRNAISVAKVNVGGSAKYAAYFGDLRANVYALDADTGALLWKTHVEQHSLAGITGSPALYNGRLYVPVSSREEGAGVLESYSCCTFRGSVVALDTSTGQEIWKTYIIPDEPKPIRKNSKGTQLYSPSGGAIWDTPTLDESHHVLYVGTGNNYTEPTTDTTDSIMAMDMDSGKVLWWIQDTPKDAWIGCGIYGTSDNCPKELGPDYDFGSSPILRTLPNGHRVLIAAQKSGMVWAHDPDRKGAVLWKAQIVEKLALGEITFGGAADDESAYFGVRSGGIRAIQLSSGERRWSAPLEGDPRTDPRAALGQNAALSAIPGVVFSGSYDGMLRALASDTGKVLWEYNMLDEVKTVNGVAAKGGSMGGPGPTVVGGMLFAGSGYVFGARGRPGNALLVFSLQ
ncbi:MAG TPA: PQQ-binding-like beta-propeller repeat protein [Candidatus Acidoferrales bacterium]|nr:PQQ-binding-like beta-propeller repeat protein [Candidatus Acidoferrales bacterium]